jgi:broad specificity phosphatase PhoE
MVEKQLYLLRHGDTGMQGRYIGSTDVPLAKHGRARVEGTGEILRRRHIEKIVCSPMLRCRQTLDLLDLPSPCHFNDLLQEIDFGRWEGMDFTQIVHSDKELVDVWAKSTDTFSFPGGEALTAFRKRIALFRDQLNAMAEERILVISHGGIIRHMLCLLLGLDQDNYLIFDVQPGSFCSLRLHDGRAVLTGFNLRG